ncbi:MAG: response regulator [Candidatus Competibacteraceae bacterium]
MAMPDDTLIALETEVAALVDLLLEGLPDAAASEAVAESEGIARYAQQVERIGAAAADASLMGLQDVCMVLQATLLELSASGRPVSDAERDLLEAWPTLVMAYLESPQDSQSSAALIQYLRDPAWNTPLSDADADVMLSLFTVPMAALEEAPTPTWAMPAADAAIVITPPTAEIEARDEFTAGKSAVDEGRLSSAPVTSVPLDSAAEAAPASEPMLPAVELEETDTANASVVTAEEEAAVTAIATAVITPTEPEVTVFTPDRESAAVDRSVAEPEEIPAFSKEVALAALATVPDTTAEIAAAEPVAVQDTTAETVIHRAVEPSPIPAPPEARPESEPVARAATLTELEAEAEASVTAVAAETAATAGELSQAAQEVLEILCAEIGQFTESTADLLTVATNDASELAARTEALTQYAEQVERFTDATAAVGLVGLSEACARIHTNALVLAARQQALTADDSEMLENWPLHVLNYLQAFHDQSICQALTACLQDSRWPEPLPATDVPALIEALLAPALLVEEAAVEARPTEAEPEDVSLALPEDVNPELLDGLLQELPNQTAEFSAAVQRLAEGTGTLEDLEVAQRIAHTLKGAGNTVGIRGVAMLAHHIEDILLALSKHAVLPPRVLAESLINAADCLETMSESLLGLSDPPAQAQGVLQEVLDWANRIDHEGIPKGDEIVAPKRPRPVGAEEALTAETAQPRAQPTTGAVPMLRIPATLVDELLRLIGESMIVSGQIQERVRQTMLHTRAVQAQNRLLHQLTADLEHIVDIRGITSPRQRIVEESGFDPLELEQYNELNSTTRQFTEAVTDAGALGQAFNDHLVALDALLVEQSRINRESQDTVMRTRMVPVKTIAPRLQRAVRQTCRLTDKEAELQVAGEETLIDSNVLNDLVDPLMHVLRNAVDHGIEAPTVRQSLGKNPVGRIALSFGREGNRIVVRCQDDGAGLDLAAIRRIAEQRGLVSPTQPIEEEDLIRLTLTSGFSTRAVATQTSGRGIGMDMVYNRILEIKGSLHIQSQPGKGYGVEMRLPLTLISTHALLVHVEQYRFAISDRGVEQILYPGSGEIHQLGNRLTYQVGDNIYALSSLDTLLHLPPDRRVKERHEYTVVLVQDETGTIHAVLVEEVLASRDLVIKNMGQYIPRLRGVVGATILGDGSVVPVLDLPELLRTPVQQMPVAVKAPYELTKAAAAPLRRLALVVDDSLSARRSLAQFVEDAGFEVRTARDGLEAVELINVKRPDIVLADLEMPRMNGLELTAHVRARDDTRTLPVVMVTSRSTEKHRREAERMGVSAYMTKPFAEDELLQQINRLLERV